MPCFFVPIVIMCEGNLFQALPYRRSGAKGGGKSPISANSQGGGRLDACWLR
jgi:hypothetical protein